VQETWQAHKQKVAELETQDLTVRGLSSFADYLEIEKIKVGMLAD
jgi:hypothetical protein